MPRLTHTPPKYRKHRASGQAVVTINRRDHYLGPHRTAASKLEYDRLIAEWLASGRSASFGAPAQQYAVIELVVDYLEFAKGYYGDGPRGTYATMVRACGPLKALYSRLPAAEFGVVQFKAVRQSLLSEDLSRGFVNEIMRRIVAVFRWGAAEGRLPASVPQTLAIIPGLRKGRCTARETAPVKPVDAATVDATLPHLPPIVADMVRFQRLTGARPGEVCGLRPGDVDRSNGEVWEACLAQHKTAHHGRERTIYIGPQAQVVLSPYLLRGSDVFCFSPAESVEQQRRERSAKRVTPATCGNRPGSKRGRRPQRRAGERYTTQSYGVAIARACDRAFPHPDMASVNAKESTPEQAAELKAWRIAHRWQPNQLRHAIATRVRREFDLDAAKTLLGHAQIGVTEVYAEKDRRRAIEVAQRLVNGLKSENLPGFAG